MKRSDFEEKSEHLFGLIDETLNSLLLKSNMKLSDINIIEIIGGSVRIPKIQQILSEFMNRDSKDKKGNLFL